MAGRHSSDGEIEVASVFTRVRRMVGYVLAAAAPLVVWSAYDAPSLRLAMDTVFAFCGLR